MYSAFGSFYIPSCIMVFVYIKIYYAARERARRNIKKPNFSKRISRKIQKLSDKDKAGGNKAEEMKALVQQANKSLNKVENDTKIANSSATQNTTVTTMSDSLAAGSSKDAVASSTSGHGDVHKGKTSLAPGEAKNGVKNVDNEPCNSTRCNNEEAKTTNNNNGLTISAHVEICEQNKSCHKLSEAGNGNSMIMKGVKKKMRFSDDTKGSDCDIDSDVVEDNVIQDAKLVGKEVEEIEVDKSAERKHLANMKVVRVETEGPQPKQIHPKKKMVHIMSAYSTDDEHHQEAVSQNSTMSKSSDQHINDEDGLMENPSATEILEITSATKPHPYGECATVRNNGVRTRRSVGVSTRSDNDKSCVQSKSCLKKSRGMNYKCYYHKEEKANVENSVITCDESNCCGCNQPKDKLGPVNQVRSLKAKLRQRFQTHANGTSSCNSSTESSRRSSKGISIRQHIQIMLYFLVFYIDIHSIHKM